MKTNLIVIKRTKNQCVSFGAKWIGLRNLEILRRRKGMGYFAIKSGKSKKKIVPAKIKHTRPVLSRETVELIKRKRQAWRKIATTHADEDYKLFCRLINKVRKLTRHFAAQSPQKYKRLSGIMEVPSDMIDLASQL